MPFWQFAVLLGEDQPKDAAQDAGWVAGTKLPSSLTPDLNPVDHDKEEWVLVSVSTFPSLHVFLPVPFL